MQMAIHSHGRTTWSVFPSPYQQQSPSPHRTLTHSPNIAAAATTERTPAPPSQDKPLPPPPLFAFADFDTDTLGVSRPSTKVPPTASSSSLSRPVSPVQSVHQSELKRQDSGVAIELESDGFSSFVASSPSIFKESVLNAINFGNITTSGMSASPPSSTIAEQRRSSGVRAKSANRKSMGPRLPVRVMSSDSNGGLEPSLKVVERPLTPSTTGDSSVRHLSHQDFPARLLYI